MRHAVTASTPPKAASGTREMTGPSSRAAASSTKPWMMAVRRVAAPLRTATLARAMAAVAGTPPKKGTTMLPTPWANSS